MGLVSDTFGGSGSASTSTSSDTTSWLAAQLEPIITGFIGSNPSIDYTDSTVSGLTGAQQSALNRYGSGNSIQTGTGIAKHGASLVSQAVGEIQGLLHGGAKQQFMGGVSGIYGAADGFIDNQNAAIQDQVYSEMGNTFGQTAQSNMASTSVAGSSAAQNATNSVLASGANKMTQMMADVSSNVLKSAVGITGNAMGAETSLIGTLLREGGSMFGTGAHMAATGAANQFKAGTFEQWFNQQVSDNNRKNTMVNNNMEWLNMGALLDMVLPTAGLQTHTDGTSSTSKNKGGIF
ncbi:Uncharacterised protein [Serratia quinivorans]|uniref:hypothetical protein n=1 Tax=Serratia quinivorans TaxID=137545 RepID=UPI002179F564|nr:hypothetical protein [Serratia quinivorans]CAI1768676.1 Uncharacterised protein [Serratia quinivorans]